MEKKSPTEEYTRKNHPDKDYFRKLIENETDPDKRRQLQEEEQAHNHPNREKKP